jgi:hypothetical protein
VADENWEFSLSRMTRDRAMGKINYDAGSKRRGTVRRTLFCVKA